MALNLGNWDETEKNLVLAGCPATLVAKRTGRTVNSVTSFRYRLSVKLGKKIEELPEKVFLAKERALMRELKGKKSITIAEIRAKRATAIEADVKIPDPNVETTTTSSKEEKCWKEVAPGAGYICVEGKEAAPNSDALFFEINGVKITVSAGTKKVDVLPYGLIIEF